MGFSWIKIFLENFKWTIRPILHHFPSFGSLIRSPQLGLVWNNHMDDFAQPNETNSYGLEPAKSNMIEPGKRPMSSMSPMIVYQKDNRKVHKKTGKIRPKFAQKNQKIIKIMTKIKKKQKF